MKRRSFLAWVSLGATAGMSACRCGNESAQQGGAGGADAGEAVAPGMTELSFALDNGLQVDLVHGPCGETVAVAVLVGVGVDHDPAGRSGMATLTEHVLASSAKAKQAVEAGGNYTLYSAAVPAAGVAAELDAVASWMTQVPSADDLERERKLVLAELAKLRGEDAALTAKSLAEESMRPTHNNGRRRGLAADVEKISHAELETVWNEHFKAGNTRVVVVGAFDAPKIRAHIEKAFGAIAKGTPPEAGEPIQATVRGTLVMGDAPTAVAIAVPAPEFSSPVFPSFLVLATRLANASASGWTASYDPIRRPELLFITGPVDPSEQPEPAANKIRAEVAKLLEGPITPEDVPRTQERFRLLLEPGVVDPEVCAADPRAFAIARARRSQLQGVPGQEALVAAGAELDAARELFGAKRSAAVIAGGSIAEPPSGEKAKP